MNNFTYWNEEWNKPLSREFLEKRGFCCGNKCKNCPYTKSVKGNKELKK